MNGKRSVYSILLIKLKETLRPTGFASPPLGVMSLAAYIRRKGGINVRIIDMVVSKMTYAELDRQIRLYNPDLVGISVMTYEAKGMHRVAQLVKTWRQEVPVVVGGPHATSYPEDVLADRNVDLAVIGEGEVTFDELIDAIRNGGNLDEVRGIAYRCDGRVVFTPPRELIADLDALPLPAWDLIPVRSYKNFGRFSRIGTRDYGVLFTSRGCPYRCVYCHRVFGKTFRAMSAARVFEDIRTLYTQYGIREFEVIDDVFNLDRQRTSDICEMIIRSGMKISLAFPNAVRGDILDEDLIRKLARAGTRFMTFAVETASPRLQKLIRKNLDLDKIRQNVPLALNEGIICAAFFMLGFPTETRQEMQATLDFAAQLPVHFAHFFVVNAFKNTALAEWVAQMGKSVKTDCTKTYLTRDFDNLSDIPTEEFARMRSAGLRRFWINPSRVFRILRDYPDREKVPGLTITFLKRLALHGQGV